MSECSGNSLAMRPRPAGRLEAFFLAACARPTTYSMAARVAHGGGREVVRAFVGAVSLRPDRTP